MSDHDLLITLDQKVSDIATSIKDLKEGTAERISSLESGKADKKEFEQLQKKVDTDVETRLRKVETSTSKFLIMTGIYSAIGGTVIALIIYHIFHSN